jgi:hypothetical protein
MNVGQNPTLNFHNKYRSNREVKSFHKKIMKLTMTLLNHVLTTSVKKLSSSATTVILVSKNNISNFGDNYDGNKLSLRCQNSFDIAADDDDVD